MPAIRRQLLHCIGAGALTTAAMAALPPPSRAAQADTPQPAYTELTVMAETRAKQKPAGKAQRPQRICRKWCAADMNPCDPPEFKYADGRCSFWDNY